MFHFKYFLFPVVERDPFPIGLTLDYFFTSAISALLETLPPQYPHLGPPTRMGGPCLTVPTDGEHEIRTQTKKITGSQKEKNLQVRTGHIYSSEVVDPLLISLVSEIRSDALVFKYGHPCLIRGALRHLNFLFNSKY